MPETYEVTRDILSLIGKKLTRTEFKTWGRMKTESAIEYAGAAHFRASDNNNKVPKIPRHVKMLPEIKFRGII